MTGGHNFRWSVFMTDIHSIIFKVFSNEGYPFQMGDDSNKKCMHLQFLNTFSFRTTWPITTELGTKMSLVKGIQICSMRENNDTMKMH